MDSVLLSLLTLSVADCSPGSLPSSHVPDERERGKGEILEERWREKRGSDGAPRKTWEKKRAAEQLMKHGQISVKWRKKEIKIFCSSVTDGL